MEESFTLTCISDLHGNFPRLIGGDLLIIAGDITARDEMYEYEAFNEWCGRQQYEKVIVIAGNHDGMMEKDPAMFKSDACNFTYLCNTGTSFRGCTIWGSPYTPVFCDWSFMGKQNEMKAFWEMIPRDVDILVTHGPAWMICDKNEGGEFCGCKHLRSALDERVAPLLHVFGHIHEQGGKDLLLKRFCGNRDTLCVNVAHVNERYRVANDPSNFVVYCGKSKRVVKIRTEK